VGVTKNLILFASLFLLFACDEQSRGFNLPQGNAEQGRMTFILLQCSDCHSVNSVPWTGDYTDKKVNVTLGGKVTKIKTYGDLVTSIINPSHKLARGDSPGTTLGNGRSAMRNYNGIMSVQELIDLVEFLQSNYEVWVPDYYTYRH
jgi:sulfur-oxidizing protein SoxX